MGDWLTVEELAELRQTAEDGRRFRQLYMNEWPNRQTQCEMRTPRSGKDDSRCPNAAEFRVEHVDRDNKGRVCGQCLLPAVRMARSAVVVTKIDR